MPRRFRPFTSFLTQGMNNTNKNINNMNQPQFNSSFGNPYNPPMTKGFGAGGTGTGGGYMGGAQPGGAQYEDPGGSMGGLDNIPGGDYGGHAGYGDFWYESGWSGQDTSDAPLNWGIWGLDMNNDGIVGDTEDWALWEQYQEAIGTDPGAAGAFIGDRAHFFQDADMTGPDDPGFIGGGGAIHFSEGMYKGIPGSSPVEEDYPSENIGDKENMPTDELPPGYVWQYDDINGEWVPVYAQDPDLGTVIDTPGLQPEPDAPHYFLKWLGEMEPDELPLPTTNNPPIDISYGGASNFAGGGGMGGQAARKLYYPNVSKSFAGVGSGIQGGSTLEELLKSIQG